MVGDVAVTGRCGGDGGVVSVVDLLLVERGLLGLLETYSYYD